MRNRKFDNLQTCTNEDECHPQQPAISYAGVRQ